MTGKQIEVDGDRGTFSIDDATYAGRRLAVTVERVRTVVGRLETVAVRMIEKAQDAYRYVQNLDLIKSGRSRRLVDETYHIQSEQTVIKADQDVKVKGDKIYLG